MRLRRGVSVAIALCLLVLGWGLTTRLLKPPPGVTLENCQRVRAGMMLQDVEAILGPAADDKAAEHQLADGVRRVFAMTNEDLLAHDVCVAVATTKEEKPTRIRTWRTQEACVVVGFNRHDKVAALTDSSPFVILNTELAIQEAVQLLEDASPEHCGPLRRLRSWLGW
jgi:hypothetical protein